MSDLVPSSSARAIGRAASALATVLAAVAGGVLLAPNPLADAFFAGWVVIGVGLAGVGAVAAWTDRRALLWLAALCLTGLSVVGMWSIGLFFAPAALFTLGAAVALHLAGPRQDARAEIAAHPPSVPAAVSKTLAGVASLVVGVALVDAGALSHDLWGACVSETLACAVEKTHWDVAAVTLLGLAAIGVGGWLVWKQVYVARVLATASAE